MQYDTKTSHTGIVIVSSDISILIQKLIYLIFNVIFLQQIVPI